MGYQYTSIIGNLGQDPDLRTTNGGTSVCNFSVAVTEKYKNKETTTWFRVTAWSRLAEICKDHLRKGDKVMVSGKIRTDKYEKDGQTLTSWELVARDMEMLGGGRKDSPPANQPSDDDLPF